MEFRVLGRFEVEHGGRLLKVRRLERCLLAILLLEANTVVPVERLVALLWDQEAPRDPRAAIHTYVSRLRAALGTDGEGEHGLRLVRAGGGYLAAVDPDAVDALRFRSLATRARGVENPAERAALLRRGLALWRGPMLADTGFEHLRDRLAAPWHEARLTAIEAAIEAELACGRHHDLVGELRALTAEHPYRERLTGLLMLALYRAGRQAEALETYQHARRALIDQLGIEPGPELRRLHERVLAADDDLLAPPPGGNAPAPSPAPAPTPRQLPSAPRHFTGRLDELDALTVLLEQTSATGGMVVISAIDGMAGIGKTALAVHASHRLAEKFPDGQLFLDLHGYTHDYEPRTPDEALDTLLRALGVPPQRIPQDLEERAALYRQQLADTRTLIVLDNAATETQVRPLLPGSTGCLVLITSRRRFKGLDDARTLSLDVLPHADAIALLRAVAGPDRIPADDPTAGEIADLCGRLPLAVRIAAALLRHRPAWTSRHLAGLLRDQRQRVAALSDGDRDLGAVFDLSYRNLDEPHQLLFRRLGLSPGPDTDAYAAAALADTDPATATRLLEDLVDHNLLTEHTPGRYRLHDLLRTYAAEQAGTVDAAAERRDALRRMCDFYLRTAAIADHLLYPHRQPAQAESAETGVQPLALTDEPAAIAWFDAEHPNLLAAQHTAATYAWHATVWQLAATLIVFHRRRARRDDELAVWRAALEAAEHLPDPASRIRAHRFVGQAYTDLGRHHEATEHLNQALALAEHHDDPVQQANNHQALAWVWGRRGDDRQTLYHATRALDLYRALDQPVAEAIALNAVGWCTARLGEYDTAREHCQAALALHRRLGNPDNEAETLDSLGYIEFHTGHHHQAIDHYRQAVALRRDSYDIYETANSLDALGHPHAALGEHEQARAVWREAVDLYHRQGRTQDAERVQHQLDTLASP